MNAIFTDRPLLKRVAYAAAWVSSLSLLVVMRVENVPVHVAILGVLTCFLWFSAVKLSVSKPDVSLPQPIEAEQGGDPIQDRYFDALLGSLEKNWQLCEADLDQAVSTLRNVHHALVDAIDTAQSTGMLALNSMISASHTGEVGRGFVTVSKDLVSISEQSGKDLAKIKDVISKAQVRLDYTRRLMNAPLTVFVIEPAAAPLNDLAEVVSGVQRGQDSLRRIAERYQRNSKSDVRWLQLGDAVRRLLNEVINVLYQFELRLSDVISDMRLLKLSGTLPEHQMVEFKGRIGAEIGKEVAK